MCDIKPIETEYNGYRFRSRLEARWALFFDRVGIKYEYEPEGYENNESKYLPDFYLPDEDIFVEVKGNREGVEDELLKVYDFVDKTTNRVMILSNIPSPKEPLWWFPIVYYDTLDKIVCSKHANIHRNDGSPWVFMNCFLAQVDHYWQRNQFRERAKELLEAKKNSAVRFLYIIRKNIERFNDDPPEWDISEYDAKILRNAYYEARGAKFENYN